MPVRVIITPVLTALKGEEQKITPVCYMARVYYSGATDGFGERDTPHARTSNLNTCLLRECPGRSQTFSASPSGGPPAHYAKHTHTHLGVCLSATYSIIEAHKRRTTAS